MGFGASGDGAEAEQEERLLSASNGSCSGQPSLLGALQASLCCLLSPATSHCSLLLICKSF